MVIGKQASQNSSHSEKVTSFLEKPATFRFFLWQSLYLPTIFGKSKTSRQKDDVGMLPIVLFSGCAYDRLFTFARLRHEESLLAHLRQAQVRP